MLRICSPTALHILLRHGRVNKEMLKRTVNIYGCQVTAIRVRRWSPKPIMAPQAYLGGQALTLGRPDQSTEGPRPKHGNRREPTMERRRARRPSGGAQVSGGLLQAASEGITDVSRRRFPLLSSSALTHYTAPDNWTLDSWRARDLIKSVVQW